MCNLLMAKNKMYKNELYREVLREFPYCRGNKLTEKFSAYLDSLIGSRGNTRREVLDSIVNDLTLLNNDLLKISPNIRELNVMVLDPLLECKQVLDNH